MVFDVLNGGVKVASVSVSVILVIAVMFMIYLEMSKGWIFF